MCEFIIVAHLINKIGKKSFLTKQNNLLYAIVFSFSNVRSSQIELRAASAKKIIWNIFYCWEFNNGVKFQLCYLKIKGKTLEPNVRPAKEKWSSEHIQFTFAAISRRLDDEEKNYLLKISG